MLTASLSNCFSSWPAPPGLPPGRFGAWLQGEFGWTERTARNFMAVAERFGPKTEIISDLRIHPGGPFHCMGRPLALAVLFGDNHLPMSPALRASEGDEALRLALQSRLSPAILARLDEVRGHSRLSVREILEQAIDFAWHVEMSGELDRRPELPRDESASTPESASTRYNGWTNYETWAVNLWLTNDEGTYNECRGLARQAVEDAPDCRQVRDRIWTADEAKKFLLSDRLREFVEEMNPLSDGASMFTDLLSAAISEIDWHEIAEAFLEEVADCDQ